MPRETEPSVNERAFILEALDEGLRLDGRPLDSFRQLELTFGDEYGFADVRLGKTRVVTRISCEVTIPYPDRKFDGIFSISTELSPMASPAFEVGRQTTSEVLLSRLLEKAIRRSSALDTESLCLIAGQKCFAIRADVHVLSHDGNLVDCACVGVVAALQHFRRPEVTVEEEDVRIWDAREREPIRLSMLHHPLCVTFSYFRGGDIVVVDASLAEERVRDGEVVVTINKFGEVCQIAKYGGVPVDGVRMLGWTAMALDKVKVMTAYIQERLADDERRRDIGGLMAELSAENER